MKNSISTGTKIMLICSILFFQVSLYSQNIEKLYLHIPDHLNPVLTMQQRLELVEYAKANQGDTILNRYGNKTYLLLLDTLNQQIKVKNTSSSLFEMKVLYFPDGQPLVGLIRTVCAPVCHSMIQFYDTAWNVIPLQFNYPKAIDWLNVDSIQDSTIDVAYWQKILENTFVTLTFEEGSERLIANNNSLDFLNDTDRKIVTPFVKNQSILFRLQGETWIKEP